MRINQIYTACCYFLLFLMPFASQATGLEVFISLSRVHGEDSMYHYEIEGVFLNAMSKEPVEGVEVMIMNRRNNRFQVKHTGLDGKFQFELHDQSVYSLVGSKPHFFDSKTINISTIGRPDHERIPAEMPIQKMELNRPYLIDFDFLPNEASIYSETTEALDWLFQMMSKNPEMEVEIGVHTDSRGDDAYNLDLSQQRANRIVQYLVYHGISEKRLSAKGYGETRLINACGNDVRCSAQGHQQNRRVEFRIIKL